MIGSKKFTGLPAVLITVLVSIFPAPPVNAQSYTALSPNSDLVCVYLPNGKSQIARITSKGYKTIGFKSATKSASKDLSKARGKALQVNRLIKKLQKQKAKGKFSINAKDFKAVRKFYLESDLNIELSPTLDDKIFALEQIRSNFLNQQAYHKQIINLIKKCKKREIPEAGSVEVIYSVIRRSNYDAKLDSSGEGYVAVFAKVPAEFTGSFGYFCFERPALQGGGAKYAQLSSRPCYTELLSSLAGACDQFIDYDSRGNPKFYYGLLTKLNFYYKDRPGATSFEDAARATEARIRASNTFGGWTDSTRYVKVKNVDLCQRSLFQ